ncbi:MAG: biotin--[acetyl-CoA-carboxylase] ligase [Bacteroidales bacterium]|nr:biotin--[acetyl-CoA-carboxylase] ligase [Bacteroidales bacterium]
MNNPLLQFIPDASSTNVLLTKMAAESLENGTPLAPFTTIYTDFQADGHGMGSNKWFSDRGKNILLSVYFPARTDAKRQFLFNQYFAIATRQFLLKYLPEVDIKWPNDIYVKGHKMAGILIEHHLRGDALQYTIAGIGIDVNQDYFPENIPHPTSLYLETGKTYPVEKMIEEYWEMLKTSFEHYDWGTSIEENTNYIQHLYQLNEWHEYIIRGTQCEAQITGLDAYGQLKLRLRDGSEALCGFKEIVFL